MSLLVVSRVSLAGGFPSVPCWWFPECPLLVVFRVSLLVVFRVSPGSGRGIFGPLGTLLGLIFSQYLLVRPGKRPEGPPKSPVEGPGSEKKYS